LVSGKGRKLLVSAIISLLVLSFAAVIDVLLVRTGKQVEKIVAIVQPLRVGVIEVQRQDLVEQIVGYGTARSMRTTNLTAEVAGTVSYRDQAARAGHAVLAGQVLFRIDQRDYQQRLEQLWQNIEAQKAQLEQLELEQNNYQQLLTIAQREERIAADEYKRVSNLFSEKSATDRERDVAEASLQGIKRQVQQYRFNLVSIKPRSQVLEANLHLFESQLETAKLNLQRCTVRVPFDGQIVLANVDVGQTVQPGFTLAILIDPGQIEIPVELPAAVHARVTIGADAQVEPEVSQPGLWTGVVARIDARINPSSRTFQAYVVVKNPLADRPLIPGAFVRVKITGPKHQSALVIPRSALRDDHVFLARGRRAERRSVQIQRILGQQAVIQEGLQPGDKLITTNLDVLYDGSAIELTSQTVIGPTTTAVDNPLK